MRKPVAIVFSLVVLVGAVWLAVHRPGSDDRIDDQEVPASPAEPAVREAPPVAESETPARPKRAPQTTADNASDTRADPDAWEVVEYGDFVKVREYRRRCETVLNVLGPGEGDEVTTCERKFEIDHPYALFTDAQLAQIAGTDGEAAYILAHRQLFPPEPGAAQDIEAGVNNVLGAMIRGAEGQALNLLLDDAVFSPYTDPRSFLLWSMVGEQLGIASPEQVERLQKFEETSKLADIETIEKKAAEIAGLLREQRLIVLGTEF
jgi:hypothetical protein